MKVVWIDSNGNKSTITNFIQDVTWSGSAGQATRQLSISVLYSPLDKNIKDLNIKLGDRLRFYDDGYLLIDAMVYKRGKQSEQGTITYDSYDDLKGLVKSNCTHNFKNTNAETITRTLCNELNIKVGTLPNTKVPVKKLIIESEGFYSALIKTYMKVYKATGDKYMPIMIGRKLSIIKKGEIIDNFYLSDKVNITSSNYEESLEDMINLVKIYNDKGKQVGVIKNDKHISLYGIFQDVYTKEDGVNATKAAKSMLVGVSKEASIEAIGNIKCISGYRVKIKDTITGLTGKFWIESDSHTWSGGVHTMSLNLAFKNIMEAEE